METECSVPLPPWVLEETRRDPDIVYADRLGRRNPEYISLGCDTLPVLMGRTPIQVYSDYMRSFKDRFNCYLGHVIVVSIKHLNNSLSSRCHQIQLYLFRRKKCFRLTLEFRTEHINLMKESSIRLQTNAVTYLLIALQEIQVGMGPCGELRYPSYPESNGTWRFPGIGEFQCYDKVTI